MQKIIYLDGQETKVIKGEILNEDLMTVTIKGSLDGRILTLGKHFVVKIDRGVQQ